MDFFKKNFNFFIYRLTCGHNSCTIVLTLPRHDGWHSNSVTSFLSAGSCSEVTMMSPAVGGRKGVLAPCCMCGPWSSLLHRL